MNSKEQEMNKPFSFVAGIVFILIGGLGLLFTFAMPAVGLATWRLWPLAVIGGGLLFALPPFVVRGQRGLGGLFIPALPVLTTGSILLFTSVFNAWGAWAWLWPLEVISVAVGFVFAAIYMWQIWLIVPAVIIGLNGLVLQFCAITGLWQSWAVLWTVEPLSVGLALLLVSARVRSKGVFLAGIILCGLAGVGLVGMTAIFSGWWLFRLAGPALIVLVGLLLLVWSMLPRSQPATAATISEN
jgi:hypothetical protein